MEENTALTVTTPQKMQSLDEMKGWYSDFVKFSQEILVKELDYGIIPGVAKPSLLKPGAEKLRLAYGLFTDTGLISETCDYEKGILDFTYKTVVTNSNGKIIATCDGNANSFEPKFRYTWVKEHQLPKGIDKDKLVKKETKFNEFKFAIDKAETTGNYGKPMEYWNKFKEAIASGIAKKVERKTQAGKPMEAWEISDCLYRVDNPDIIGMKNTLMKMAQKRSFVGAMLISTGASQFYTQDVEDLEIDGVIATDTVKHVATIVDYEVVDDKKGKVVTNKAPLTQNEQKQVAKLKDETGIILDENESAEFKAKMQSLQKEIGRARTMKTLTAIYDRERDLHKNEIFMKALTTRKAEINAKKSKE
jgi:hypothetical protein